MKNRNILTIDFEEWFDGLLSLKNQKDYLQSKFSRIEKQANLLLEILNKQNIKATFFVVGRVAKNFPMIIREINNNGHEVALHSYNHDNINLFSNLEFDTDIKKNKDIVETIINKKIIGYRAPFFSIDYENRWFLDILEKNGILYDSSLHLGYNFFLKKKRQIPNKHKIKVIPISTTKFLGQDFIYSGGFYFRALPIKIINAIYNLKKDHIDSVFYFHPWEFDNEQPLNFNQITIREKISHYMFIKKNLIKFEKFIKNKKFVLMRELVLNQ